MNLWVEGCGFPSSLQLSSRADEGTLPALPACLDTAVAIPRVEKAQSLTFETWTQTPIFPVSWGGRPAPLYLHSFGLDRRSPFSRADA